MHASALALAAGRTSHAGGAADAAQDASTGSSSAYFPREDSVPSSG
jgi:hypothetical protein